MLRTVFVIRARAQEDAGEWSCFVVVALGGKNMNSVEDLDVFKLAHQLALKIYSVTKQFPREEIYSLVDQTRRAAGSVGDESYGRRNALG